MFTARIKPEDGFSARDIETVSPRAIMIMALPSPSPGDSAISATMTAAAQKGMKSGDDKYNFFFSYRQHYPLSGDCFNCNDK
jgi:hypothetical protein